jgi:hypothetical protein
MLEYSQSSELSAGVVGAWYSCALTRADGMESETAFYMYYSLEV